MMGKLRHRGFRPPAHCLQPEPAPHQPHPCSLGGHCQPLLLGDLSCEYERSRTALEEQNKTINHPCFIPPQSALCGASGTPHQSRSSWLPGCPKLAAGVSQPQTGSALPTGWLSALPTRAWPLLTA